MVLLSRRTGWPARCSIAFIGYRLVLKGPRMKKISGSLAIAATVLLAACGGGSGSSPITAPPTATPVPVQKPTAVQSISIRVPIPDLSVGAKKPSSTSRTPQYVSLETGKITLLIDKTVVVNGASIAASQSTTTTTMANGQTVTFSATAVKDTNGSGYYQLNSTLDLLPGTHLLGVVLQAPDGFVLSEGEQSYTLKGGDNGAAQLALKPVVDSAFLCDQPACVGNWHVAADGTYDNIIAFASDHQGYAIPQQLDANNNVVPFANGPIQVVAQDTSVVSVTVGGGPFADPGNAKNLHYGQSVPNGWFSGHNLAFKCLTTGSTIISMKVGPQAAGSVEGFDYTQQIDPSKDPVNPGNGTPFAVTQTAVWTTPNQFVGTVPTYQDFGNEIHINCDASLHVSII
jgi:hypothetical protein